MSSYQIVEFAVLKSDVGYAERATVASKQEGLLQQYAGPKIEDPSQAVHVTVWTSAEAHARFAAMQELAKPLSVEVLAVAGESAQLTAALESPATEVFTGYGAQAGYHENVLTFRGRMDAVEARPIGFKAAAVVATTKDITLSTEVSASWAGAAVKLIIGWTSREAHLAAKEKPEPITSNLALLKEHSSAGDMYHVQFKKL